MKQFKIIQAFKLLEDLAKIENLSADEQWSLYQLRKQLRPHFEFQKEREQGLFEKYKDFVDEEGNLLDSKTNEYLKDLNEIGNIEIELNIDIKPKIRFVKGITFITAEQLEDFIEFVHE